MASAVGFVMWISTRVSDKERIGWGKCRNKPASSGEVIRASSVFVKWCLLEQQWVPAVCHKVTLKLPVFTFHLDVAAVFPHSRFGVRTTEQYENKFFISCTKINNLDLAVRANPHLHCWAGIWGSLLPKWEGSTLGSGLNTGVIQSC